MAEFLPYQSDVLNAEVLRHAYVQHKEKQRLSNSFEDCKEAEEMKVILPPKISISNGADIELNNSHCNNIAFKIAPLLPNINKNQKYPDIDYMSIERLKEYGKMNSK